ncbi:hypothetical protein NQD34_017062 [Periophthalmus magnuspinnatus]|nr:hypothetical protein NQD34_017062 [Periophthalmus magnuspinnatus]
MFFVSGSPCQRGSDIFAAITENSPMGQFIANTNLTAEPGSNGLRLCLEGPNVHWIFLDGPTIRLNTSHSRVLDREVLLKPAPKCLIPFLTLSQKSHTVPNRHYRIQIQILNENDNKPEFSQESTRATISELAAVNTVVFTVKAMDADGDMLRYTIDPATLDSSYFRIDQSNSGNVVLDKPLDYETKTNLKMLIWAMETNTAERFSTSTEVIVSVQDGDDQYPHFLPCVPLSLELPVCTNPSYSTNVTEKQKASRIRIFSPGPIKAEDGDRGLDTPLKYSILSGNDWDRFVINSSTGQITLTKAAEDRRQTPFFRLNIMVLSPTTTVSPAPVTINQCTCSHCQASQLDDPIKYSIASVLVRVVAENMYPPVFNQSTYKGFVVQSSSPAAIVSTYGNQVLLIQVSDLDFPDGQNPNVQYSLYSPSVTEGLYHITQGGVLIAKTDRLYAFDRHIIQVIARDEESGEEVSASVDIEVLQRGQASKHKLTVN